MQKFLRTLMLMAVMALPFASQGQASLPISMDFEDATAFGQWTMTNCNSSTTRSTSTDAIHEGSYGFAFHWTTTPPQYLISPQFEEATGTEMVSFWYQNTSTSWVEEFSVGFSSTTNDIASFTWTTNVTVSTGTTWTEYSVMIPAGTKYVAIRSSAYDAYYLYIDDIYIGAAPTCFKVTNLAVANTTAESITLSWEDLVNDNPTYNVYLMTPTDTTLIESTTDTFYTVEDLTANTSYSFAVRTECSSEDVSAFASISGRTACASIDSLPYTCGFETSEQQSGSNPMPFCWTKNNGGTGNYPYCYSTTYSRTGNYALYFYSSSSSSSANYEIAVLPPVDIETFPLSGLQLTFWARYSSYAATAIIGTMSNPTDETTFTALDTITVNSNVYQRYDVNLTQAPEMDSYVAIRVNKGSSYMYLYIDDVELHEQPACNYVRDLAADSIGSDAVRLTWTDADNSDASYTVYNMADTTMIGTTTDSTFNVEELTANTEYVFGVMANCTEGDAEIVTVSVRTACTAYVIDDNTAYRENFDSITAGVPQCWDNSEGTTTSDSYRWSSYATGYEGRGLRFNSYSNSNGNTNILATPTMDLTVDARLSFMYKNPAGGDFSVFASIDGSDNLVTIATGLTGVSSWTLFEEYLDPDVYTNHNVVFYLKATSNYGNNDAYIYLDNFKIDAQPSCLAVTGLRAIDSLATESTVTLAWNGNANSYIVVNMADTTVAGTANDTTIEIDNLLSSRTYRFGVVADCGNETSDTMYVSAATTCGVIVIDEENIYTESFEGTAFPPTCWSRAHTAGSATTSLWTSATNQVHTGTTSAKLPDQASGNKNNLVTPQITIAGDGNYQVSFWIYRTDNYNSKANEGVKVWVNATPDTVNGTALMHIRRAIAMGDITETTTGWYEYSAVIPTTTPDTFYVIFEGISEYGEATYIDDITIEVAPTCLPVRNVTVSNITNTSAVIRWSGNAANENATYTIYNGQEEVASELTDTVYNYTDLEENTTYNLTIVTDCGDDPAEAVPVSFHTMCDPVELPIVESFEDTSATVNCWTFDANSAANANNMGIVTFNNHKMMKFLASSYDASVNSQYLQYGYSPMINVSEDATALRVKVRYSTYYSTYSTYVQLYFGYKLADGTEIWGEDGHTSTGTTTFAYAIDTIPATAVQVMVKYRSTSYSTSYAAYIDSIMVEEIEDEICFPVANLNIDSVTTESISISWVSDAESFTVLNMNDTTVVGTASETNYTIEELEANTVYTFGVVVNCSSSTSDTIYVTGRTECAAYATPYTWTFDTLMTANATPICFNHIGAGVANVQTSQHHSGTRSVKFSGASGNNILVMPQTVAEANTLQLNFWTKPEDSYTSCGNFTVGYLTNAADPTTYVVLDSMNVADFGSSPAYTLKTVMYANVPEGARMAMRHNATSSSYYWFVDDITIEELPACVPVSQLAATMAEDGAYTLTWVSNAESFTILNMADSSVAGTASENSFTIDNLEAMTTYTYGVTVNCGNENSDTVVVSFTTPCDAIATPYFEDFEAGNASITCWSMVNTHTSTGFQTSGGINGSGCFRFYYSTNPPQYLISPMLSIPEGDSVMLEFRYKAYSTSYTETFHVGYSYTGNNVSDFTWGPEISTNITSYQLYNTMLSDSVKFIAFKYTADDQYYLFIDSLYIGMPPTCFPVTDLTVDTIDETSATISWNGTSASYSIYKNGVYVTNVTDTTYSFTDLVASTSYTFGVRGVCDVDDSTTIVNVTATTPCAIITDFPYTQDFNSEPACWTAIDADGDGYNWFIYSGAMQSASYDDGVLTPDNWLISPQFGLPATGNYEVTWTAMAQDQSWPAEHYGVYVSTTGNNTTDFTMLQEWTLSTGAYNPVIDLSDYAGQNIYIALRHFNCTDMFRMSIDDFIVREQAGANQVVINVQQNNPAYGSVSGAGVFNIGDSVTVSATAAYGYVFNRWVDADNVTISTENPYTFAAATNLTLKAIFLDEEATMYTITVEVNDSTMGTAIGGGSYASGDIATLSATAYPGYHFVEWVQVSGSSTNPVSEDATFTISVTGNKTFRANFEADGTPVEYVEATIDTSDIVYWVGSGANRAMIAVNWVGAAYAWGVNFSTPSITVQAAMDSIVANDTRFNYTAAGGYLSNITFQEGCINLSGDTTSWWESKRNGVGGDMGLGQSLVNGDLEKWAQPVAGVWTDSVWDADWEYWYQVYTYTDSIVPMWAPQVGIESVPEYDAVIYSANSTIFVKGAEGQNIYVYDLNGRTVATKVNATETMAIPMGETGVYLVRIGNAAAKRVIVMR